jgi:hypothetical protein
MEFSHAPISAENSDKPLIIQTFFNGSDISSLRAGVDDWIQVIV